jgi:phosphoribosylaminoimidazole-succinocarboxamide synthase
MNSTLFESNITDLKLHHRGKVRDLYDVDDKHMLIVTTDRISAFDVILPSPIPGKGAVLTAISNFWFRKMQDIVPNHLTNLSLQAFIHDSTTREVLSPRSVVVQKLKALPVEVIIRGYLIGSGWKDYRNTKSICGISLPDRLRQADRLPEPIFTPSTKAQGSNHDINVDFQYIANLLGADTAHRIRDVGLALYTRAAAYALERGIIIADTKFEFGMNDNAELMLIDEALTPDSSRFWPLESYRPGISPPSFDKQFVRDYLETLDWDKTSPGPALPKEIINRTAEKYLQAKRLLLP